MITCNCVTPTFANTNNEYAISRDNTGKFIRGITTQLTGVYSDASTNSLCIDVVPANKYVRVVSSQGRFYKVRARSQYGYVLAKDVLLDKDADNYVEDSGNFQLMLLVVADTTLSGLDNVGQIGVAHAGDVLSTTGRYNSVYKVNLSDGLTAFVPAKDVSPYYDVQYHNFSDINFAQINEKTQELQSIINDYSTVLKQKQQEYQAAKIAAACDSSRGFDSTSAYLYYALENTTDLRKSIVSYALQFVGNPYVWGGTSLTNGADCSGFCQSVLRNFGISISRCSYTQCRDGREVALSEVQPGDLIFYKRGLMVGHVVMYVGDGKVVQARGKDYGICITDMYYDMPYCARNVID